MRAAAFEFIFCNHFHILYPISLWDNRILSCSLGFESGFTGFRGFLPPGRGLGWCALQHENNFLSTFFTFYLQLTFGIIGFYPVAWV
jgi:hypothetical protein